MAESLVAGSIVGALVNSLVDELITALKHVKNRDRNLRELSSLLERSQPFVGELRDFLRDKDAHHPAVQWFGDLQEQLEKARLCIFASDNDRYGPYKRWRTSTQSLRVYERISYLLNQAAIAKWASELHATKGLSDYCSRDQARVSEVLQEMKVEQSRHGKNLEQIKHAVTSEPSFLRKRGFGRTVSDSQAPPLRALVSSHGDPSSSNGPGRERERRQAWDSPDPQISFGGDVVANQLIKNLVAEESYNKWVGIWAMGGAGKTFTARKVFNDSRIREHFTGGRFWITVSKDGPSRLSLVKSLFDQIQGADGPSSPTFSSFPTDEEAAKAKVRTQLRKKYRALLVLDDVWESDIIGDFDVISEDQRGVILVTTRDDDNLRKIAKHAQIVKIPQLSKADSWELFCCHAFQGRNPPPELEAVARAVAEECSGLPLALEVIGASMKDIFLFERELRLDRNLRGEWEKALKTLQQASNRNYAYNKLYDRLQLSLENLRNEHPRLLDCFFYFGAFPEDYEVDKRRLMSMWIAEGMVTADKDSPESVEEEADVLLGWLIGKSMVEWTEDGERCKVHDVMRDLARHNMKRDFHTRREIEASQRTCLFAARQNITQFPREWNAPVGTRFMVERFSLFDNDLRRLPEHFNAPHLRVLILSENPLRALPPSFFRALFQLRVLDLSKTSIEELPDGVLKSLKSLVLLDLTDCFYLRTISDRIADQHTIEDIRISGCWRLEKLPRIDRLTKLHTFSATIPQYVSIDSKKRWTKARGWGRHGKRVFQRQSLRRLSVYNFADTHLPDSTSFLLALEEFTLIDASRLLELPESILRLPALKVLRLVKCGALTSLPALDEIPRLETLVLEKLGALNSFPESFGKQGAFPSLKRLEIHVLEGVGSSITLHPESMQQLQALVISGPQRYMRNTYDTIETGRFPNLQYVELYSIEELPNVISGLPKLSLLRCKLARNDLPRSILELEAERKLKIERNLDTEREQLRVFEPLNPSQNGATGDHRCSRSRRRLGKCARGCFCSAA